MQIEPYKYFFKNKYDIINTNRFLKDLLSDWPYQEKSLHTQDFI